MIPRTYPQPRRFRIEHGSMSGERYVSERHDRMGAHVSDVAGGRMRLQWCGRALSVSPSFSEFKNRCRISSIMSKSKFSIRGTRWCTR